MRLVRNRPSEDGRYVDSRCGTQRPAQFAREYAFKNNGTMRRAGLGRPGATGAGEKSRFLTPVANGATGFGMTA